MRVLLTGFTATQCNPQSHKKSWNYVGTLWETLRSDEHEVFWQDPSIEMDTGDLTGFDRVIVGVAPLSGLGSNRAYGALSVIEKLWGTERLALVVDAPEPVKIQTSLRAVADHPENLCKPFFSYRKEFSRAIDPKVNSRLQRAVRLLTEETWPVTLIPKLPWHSTNEIRLQFPWQARYSLAPHSFDNVLLDKYKPLDVQRQKVWACEEGAGASWSAPGAVSWPVQELPKTFRVESNTGALNQLAASEGVLIGPSRTGTWWSPRYSMAMAVETPVFTDWRESFVIGDEWGALPSTFETYSPETRRKIALEQVTSWREHTPSTADALKGLWDTLGMVEARRRRRREVK